MEFVNSLHLRALAPERRALFVLPRQRTLWCAPHWESAWERNYAVLRQLNQGYLTGRHDSTGNEIQEESVPVYKVLAENQGKHAASSSAAPFASLPCSTWLARGLQVSSM